MKAVCLIRARKSNTPTDFQSQESVCITVHSLPCCGGDGVRANGKHAPQRDLLRACGRNASRCKADLIAHCRGSKAVSLLPCYCLGSRALLLMRQNDELWQGIEPINTRIPIAVNSLSFTEYIVTFQTFDSCSNSRVAVVVWYRILLYSIIHADGPVIQPNAPGGEI